MIGFLTGRLHAKQPPMIQLDVQGVGYELEAPMSTFYKLGGPGETVTLLTYLHVREDAMLLFGFATQVEKDLFRTLIKVNGIGARMAIGILSSMSAQEFVRCVEQEDATSLTRIPGVGKKTAERLMIEMRDRLKSWDSEGAASPNVSEPLATASMSNKGQARAALESLGYKPAQAEKMLAPVAADLTLEEMIRTALKSVKL
ncbi:Holliday junction branch migration protein RuvA [Thiomicrospira sp. WB1]|uniref:Holliday junction branch migration protein RuvA n=1 Tax=Thiomicrospira sp. WB1 TaxID=1685380 RepID=UPI0007465C40|nr:Holliday junction branch migration protein RuvA [Thiomicrospira sp. WB1]KUJ72939.1 Holliday junction ATP-dependent DNA helicase RuvA [Thiomicrospira sp. WB1]